MDGPNGGYRDSAFSAKHATFEEAAPTGSFISNEENGHNSPKQPSLLQKHYKRLKSSRKDELRKFRTILLCWGLDQSSTPRIVIAWLVFVILALALPLLICVFVNCNVEHRYSSFDKLVQVPETVLAAIAFLCFSRKVRRYGLRQFLFLDQLSDDMPSVQKGYVIELERSFKLLSWILLPSFLLELVHKSIWLQSVTVNIPYVHNRMLGNAIIFVAIMLSWIYRTGVFLLVCLLFRLTCHLQTLRFEGYKTLLEEHESDVVRLLKEHMRIRHQLFLTSHRFRMFMVASLLTITLSQLIALVLILSTKTAVNFFNAGDLVVCSAVEVTGCLLCLVWAAKITHRAQAVVSVASTWHSLCTCTTHGAYYSSKAKLLHSLALAEEEDEDPSSINPFSIPALDDSDSDSNSSGVFYMITSKEALADFQMRQSFVTYIQHNGGGITLFGFVLDRGLLYALFAFEFSLVMWIISKTMSM